MAKGAEKRVANNIASVNEGIVEAYKPYYEKFTELQSALRAYARSEFQ